MRLRRNGVGVPMPGLMVGDVVRFLLPGLAFGAPLHTAGGLKRNSPSGWAGAAVAKRDRGICRHDP